MYNLNRSIVWQSGPLIAEINGSGVQNTVLCIRAQHHPPILVSNHCPTLPGVIISQDVDRPQLLGFRTREQYIKQLLTLQELTIMLSIFTVENKEKIEIFTK